MHGLLAMRHDSRKNDQSKMAQQCQCLTSALCTCLTPASSNCHALQIVCFDGCSRSDKPITPTTETTFTPRNAHRLRVEHPVMSCKVNAPTGIPHSPENAGLRETATSRAMNNIDILTMVIEKLDYPSRRPWDDVKDAWSSDILPRRVNKMWKTLWDRAFASAYETPINRPHSPLCIYVRLPVMDLLGTVASLRISQVDGTAPLRYPKHEEALAKLSVMCSETLSNISLGAGVLLAIGRQLAHTSTVDIPGRPPPLP